MAKRDSNSNNKILILRLTLFEERVCEEFVFEELVQVAAAAARLHHHRTAAAGKVFSSRAVQYERSRRRRRVSEGRSSLAMAAVQARVCGELLGNRRAELRPKPPTSRPYSAG